MGDAGEPEPRRAAAAITVAGVTTGKTYTCTVFATNARGAGPPSTASSPAITA